jgi:hypothetical protein
MDVTMRYNHHPSSCIKGLRCGGGCECRLLVLVSWCWAWGMGTGGGTYRSVVEKCSCGILFLWDCLVVSWGSRDELL